MVDFLRGWIIYGPQGKKVIKAL